MVNDTLLDWAQREGTPAMVALIGSSTVSTA